MTSCDYYEITQLVVEYKDGKTDYIDIQREPYYYVDISGENTCSNMLDEPLIIFDNCDWVTTDIELEYKQKYNLFLVMFNKNISNIQKITKKQFNIHRIV